jgi:hypothetical protein
MAKLPAPLFYLLGLVVSGGLLASCGGASESASPPAKAPPTALASPTVVDATRHYATLLASGAALATPASRRYAGVAASSSTDSSFRVVLSDFEIEAFLDSQHHFAGVNIVPHRAPEDPNRVVLAVPQPPAHLVRLGELRRAFGAGARLPPPLHVLPHYRFAYRPTPDSRPVTIEAFMPAPTYVDSARAEHLMLYLTPPK